jgi:hypothetical protein
MLLFQCDRGLSRKPRQSADAEVEKPGDRDGFARYFSGSKGPSGVGKVCVAGVLRLRAISRPLCDSSARRFAQDDDFVGR